MESLESKGFRFSRTKTKYLKCKFSDVTHAAEVGMKIDAQVIPKRESFKYLGSIIHRDGELMMVSHIVWSWVGNMEAHLWVLCNKNVLPRLKGKFYRMVARPTLLYGTECWPVKNTHIQKMKVEEMRILRWMCEHTRRNMFRNVVVLGKVRVASPAEKMREMKLGSSM